MPNPVTHFEVTGKDGKKLQEFFGKLFGWEIDANNAMNYGIVSAQDGRGAGGGIGPAMGGPGMVTFYVEVDEPQAYLDKAVSLGGSVVMPVSEIPDGPTIALFADPEGHVIGIAQGMEH
jgi:hypothetical protein